MAIRDYKMTTTLYDGRSGFRTPLTTHKNRTT